MKILSKKPLSFEVEKALFLSEGRTDAQFFHPTYLQNEELIKKTSQVKYLEQISKRIKKGIFYILALEYTKAGVPFLRVCNLKDETIVNENLAYITEEKNRKEIKTEFHSGDILISKTGSLAVSIIPETLKRCNISQDIIGIEIDKEYNSKYIAIFLASKFGVTQLERLLQGQVQQHITVADIRRAKIALPSAPVQEKIVQIMEDATAKRNNNLKEVERLRKDLEDFFLKQLHLKYPEEREENVFISELGERLDPYHYHPRFKRMIDSLKAGRFELKKLKEVAKFSNEQIDPKKDPNRLFRYIQIRDIDEVNHKISSYTPLFGRYAPGRARMIIKEGDILIPILGGSLESVAIVPRQFDNEVATNGFAILRISDKNLRYHVFYYLTTKFSQMQIERQLTGTIMPSISKAGLKNILVPLPDSLAQEETYRKVDQVTTKVYKLQKDAKHIISNSKQKIEKMIIGQQDD